MIVAERIRERMRYLGLTQAELARRVGVKQQTIGSLVSGDAHGSRFLHRIALQLQTTPAFLTGETDDPNSDVVHDPISGHEREWLEILRELDAADRKLVLTVARTFAKAAGQDNVPPTLHEERRLYRTGTHG